MDLLNKENQFFIRKLADNAVHLLEKSVPKDKLNGMSYNEKVKMYLDLSEKSGGGLGDKFKAMKSKMSKKKDVEEPLDLTDTEADPKVRCKVKFDHGVEGVRDNAEVVSAIVDAIQEGKDADSIMDAIRQVNDVGVLNECVSQYKKEHKEETFKDLLVSNLCSTKSIWNFKKEICEGNKSCPEFSYSNTTLKYTVNEDLFNAKCKVHSDRVPQSIPHLGTIFNDPNLQSVTNKLNVTYSGKNVLKLNSFRYGTILAKNGENIYDKQCSKVFEKISKDAYKTIIISLLDWAKDDEKEIIKKEYENYNRVKKEEIVDDVFNSENVIFFNMSCNSTLHYSMNFKPINVPKKELQDVGINRLTKLIDSYIESVEILDGDNKIYILHVLRNGIKILERNLYNPAERIYFDEIDNGYTEYIVTNHEQNIDESEFENRINVNGEKIRLNRTFKRYIMFCYLSLLVFLLNHYFPDKRIDLFYHCKSGQDRTGTFYVINQTVNEIMDKKLKEITEKIFYDGVVKTILEYFCPFYSERNEVNMNNFYKLTYKHLAISYLITWISTGIPGIKWNLGQKISKALAAVAGDKKFKENHFGYLLTRTADDARLFEGLSTLRSS